jgi:hypothetical protein
MAMRSNVRYVLPIVLAVAVVAAAATAVASARSTAVPRLTGEPRISGTVRVGSTLRVSNGNWANSPRSFAYQWYRCDNPGKTNCQPLAGRTRASYRLVADDAGHTIYASVTATNADGSTVAETDPVGPVAPNAAPRNTAAPTISGTPQAGQTLTVNEGSWSNLPTSFTYQWLRCDATGANCGAIGGATAKTYVPVVGDVRSTLRVRVTARNAVGQDTATSGQTGAILASTGGSAIPVALVSLPARLLISDVKFAPARLTSRAPFVARFRVVDTQRRPVAGALVYALGLPYAWLRSAPEVATDNEGWATVTLHPTASLPRQSSLVLFVRARKPGDNLLAGVSTRRLVQVTVRF